MIGLVILLALTRSAAVGAPLITEQDPNRAEHPPVPQDRPAMDHILGSDASGRDVLSRLLYAGRVSLSVGLVAVAIYTAIGVVLGALAGYYGGWVDSMIMRLADIVLAFPTLIIIITLVSVLGPSICNIMLVIGLLGWPPIARILRGAVPLAARAGVRRRRAGDGRQQPAASSSATCCRTRWRR